MRGGWDDGEKQEKSENTMLSVMESHSLAQEARIANLSSKAQSRGRVPSLALGSIGLAIKAVLFQSSIFSRSHWQGGVWRYEALRF